LLPIEHSREILNAITKIKSGTVLQSRCVQAGLASHGFSSYVDYPLNSQESGT